MKEGLKKFCHRECKQKVTHKVNGVHCVCQPTIVAIHLSILLYHDQVTFGERIKFVVNHFLSLSLSNLILEIPNRNSNVTPNVNGSR